MSHVTHHSTREIFSLVYGSSATVFYKTNVSHYAVLRHSQFAGAQARYSTQTLPSRKIQPNLLLGDYDHTFRRLFSTVFRMEAGQWYIMSLPVYASCQGLPASAQCTHHEPHETQERSRDNLNQECTAGGVYPAWTRIPRKTKTTI